MRKMNVLEEQHDEIVMLVRMIAASLAGANISTQADLIASQLEDLTSKLAVHLALEDLLVCRPMIQSQNVSLKSTAAKFRGDITCLQDICLNFAARRNSCRPSKPSPPCWLAASNLNCDRSIRWQQAG